MVQQAITLADPDFGEYSGWIELHNREDKTVNLGGWILAGQPLQESPDHTYEIPEGTTIAPNGYLLIWTDGQDVADEAIHASFTLSADGGKIGLYGPESAGKPVIDTLTYEAHEVAPDISWGRMTFAGHDHIGFLLPMNNPTPGEENSLLPLNLLESHVLSIGDPSGLGLDHSGKYFWAVSDDPGGSIYKISKTGEIIKELPVEGEDMESITQHPHNFTLWVTEERRREIVQFDTLGNEIQRYGVDVEIQNENDGLEGITINPSTNNVFVVNKRLPRVLIEMDVQRGGQMGAIENQLQHTPLNFRADKDVRGITLAGLFYEADEDVLWVVSDEARAVIILDLQGRPLAAFDAFKKDLESIALIKDENRIYLVSDEEHTMHVYEYPEHLNLLRPVQ